ncbi:MAG: hypothetical protein II574_00555 [Ruminococcus sp.]|nr:hypothetical protein [Ruminococcus sp.]
MDNKPMLVVMLTCDDQTVSNAYEIFDKCKDTKAEYWGFKEKPLPLEEMKKLYAYMKACGKKTALEVVEYTEEECLEGAKMAIECGVDLLMGTVFFDSVMQLCKEHDLKYCPFVGELKERPTVMDGSVEKMIADAKEYISKGAYGIDLLGYRYTGDAYKLIDKFVASVDAPVCVAGSINSYERLDEIKRINPASFTIGSAFFNKCFGSDFSTQIDTVCSYMEQ